MHSSSYHHLWVCFVLYSTIFLASFILWRIFCHFVNIFSAQRSVLHVLNIVFQDYLNPFPSRWQSNHIYLSNFVFLFVTESQVVIYWDWVCSKVQQHRVPQPQQGLQVEVIHMRHCRAPHNLLWEVLLLLLRLVMQVCCLQFGLCFTLIMRESHQI
jgi:hypothetical protein